MSFISLLIFLFILQKIIEAVKKNKDRQGSSGNSDQPMTWEEMERQYGILIEQKEEPLPPDFSYEEVPTEKSKQQPTIATPQYETEVDAKMHRYQEAAADKTRSYGYASLSSGALGVDLTEDIGQSEIGGQQDEMRENRQRQMQGAARVGIVWAEILKAPKQLGMNRRHY